MALHSVIILTPRRPVLALLLMTNTSSFIVLGMTRAGIEPLYPAYEANALSLCHRNGETF